MTELNNEQNSLETSEDNSVLPNLSRRALIGSGIAAAAAFAWPSVVNADTERSLLRKARKENRRLARGTSVNGFPQPGTINNGTATRPAILRAAQTGVTIPGLSSTIPTTNVRCFNGQIPAPSFRLQQGDQLNINLINALAVVDDCPGTLNQPHCSNTTNLHFHGFHVSPMSLLSDGTPVSGGKNNEVAQSSDDVLYELEPSSSSNPSHPYCVSIPSFHAPGTHWYHPHKHGSTALQLVDGMAGALIIEDPPADAIEVNEDLVWVVQEILGDNAADVYQCNGLKVKVPNFSVNGAIQPTLTMKSGELHRWRFINATATPRGFITLKFQKDMGGGDWQDIVAPSDGQTGVYRIAVDGISHYGQAPQFMASMDLSPANRADFLVKLPPGTYRVFKAQSNVVGGGGFGQKQSQMLATITVTDETITDPININFNDNIPGSFPRYLRPFRTPAPTPTKSISFDAAGPGCGPTSTQPIQKQFETDNAQYMPPGPGETVQNVNIGTDEVWLLTNTTGAAHPFHIHVNPFKVIEFNGNAIAEADQVWWDTFYIPAGGSIKIRHRFTNYPGKFVFHCHILIHEDLGMMQDVNVNGTGLKPCQPVGGENFTYNGQITTENIS